MSAHTSGPWRADVERDKGDKSTRIIVRAVGEHCSIVCRITPIIEGSTKRWAEEDMSAEWRAHSVADASLIAAAPDLLKELRLLNLDQNGEQKRNTPAWRVISAITGEVA